MNRPILLGYQLLTGVSDSATGALLMIAPVLTLRLLHLHAAGDELPFLSFIGAFVLSVGLACMYGAYLVYRAIARPRLEAVWLLTALTRASVSIFVLAQVAAGTLEAGWLAVALFDGVCVVIQAAGLRGGWLIRAAL